MDGGLIDVDIAPEIKGGERQARRSGRSDFGSFWTCCTFTHTSWTMIQRVLPGGKKTEKETAAPSATNKESDGAAFFLSP